MQKPLLGYVIAAVIGAVISVVAGYLVYAAPGDAVTFNYWLKNPIRFSVFAWSLVGILCGAGLHHLTRKRTLE